MNQLGLHAKQLSRLVQSNNYRTPRIHQMLISQVWETCFYVIQITIQDLAAEPQSLCLRHRLPRCIRHEKLCPQIRQERKDTGQFYMISDVVTPRSTCKALFPAFRGATIYPFLDRVTLGVIPPFPIPLADPLA